MMHKEFSVYTPSNESNERYAELMAHYDTIFDMPTYINGRYNLGLDGRTDHFDELISEIMLTVDFFTVAQEVGTAVDVRTLNTVRVKMALEDNNLQTVSSRGNTVAELIQMLLDV